MHIDPKENRYIVITDIPGAFLHADMEDRVHMLLKGTILLVIVKIDFFRGRASSNRYNYGADLMEVGTFVKHWALMYQPLHISRQQEHNLIGREQ